MKVTVTTFSYDLSDYKGRMSFRYKTDALFTRENKTELMNRICRLIETEIENHELLKETPKNLTNGQ